ncbi:unnamed protein product, partial [Ascophyllum nodosum]
TEGEHAGVNTRIKDAWEASWRQGKFSDNEDALLCLHADDDTRYPLNSHEIPI